MPAVWRCLCPGPKPVADLVDAFWDWATSLPAPSETLLNIAPRLKRMRPCPTETQDSSRVPRWEMPTVRGHCPPQSTSWPGAHALVRQAPCHCPTTKATVANADAASWWLTHCPVLCPWSLDRALPPCLSSLYWTWVRCLTNSASQIPALVKTLVSFSIHVTMLATDDGWGGHNSAKWRAPSDNILDNSGRLLTSPCVNASWNSACRSSNQFVTSFGTWQSINGIRPSASRRDDACRETACFFTTG